MPIVNYVREHERFIEYAADEGLTANEMVLWYALMHIINARANGNEWPGDFIRIDNNRLLTYCPMGFDAMARARNKLKQKGLIDFKAGERNKVSPAYKMNYFCPQETRPVYPGNGGGYPQTGSYPFFADKKQDYPPFYPQNADYSADNIGDNMRGNIGGNIQDNMRDNMGDIYININQRRNRKENKRDSMDEEDEEDEEEDDSRTRARAYAGGFAGNSPADTEPGGRQEAGWVSPLDYSTAPGGRYTIARPAEIAEEADEDPIPDRAARVEAVYTDFPRAFGRRPYPAEAVRLVVAGWRMGMSRGMMARAMEIAAQGGARNPAEYTLAVLEDWRQAEVKQPGQIDEYQVMKDRHDGRNGMYGSGDPIADMEEAREAMERRKAENEEAGIGGACT